jgi:autotransporter-associated beta strand protein
VARLSGVISGSANADLIKTGGGTLELTGINTYLGNTYIQQGTLAATGGGAIPNTSAVILSNTAGATFLLNSSETIGTISGGGTTGGNVNIQANTLTLGDQRDTTFAGAISGSGGAVVKQGSGTLTLTGANTYTGGTTLSAGTVVAGNNSAFGSTGAQTITFNGGSLASNNDARTLANNLTVNNVAGNQITGSNSVTFTGSASGAGTLEIALTDPSKSATVNPATANGFAPGILRLTSGTLLLGGNNTLGSSTNLIFNGGTLGMNNYSQGSAGTAGLGSMSISATSVLDFGTLGAGSNTLAFGSLGTHTASTALQITDYDIGSDHLYFSGTSSSFTGAFAQNDISFNGTSGYAAISFGGYYEIVAVPEPTTILGALGLLGFIGYRERRRLRRL